MWWPEGLDPARLEKFSETRRVFTKICHIFMCNIFTTLSLLFLYYDPFWTGILILRLSTFGKNEFSSKVNKITNRIQNLIFTLQFWYRKTLYTGFKCVLVETFISTCHFSIKKKRIKENNGQAIKCVKIVLVKWQSGSNTASSCSCPDTPNPYLPSHIHI